MKFAPATKEEWVDAHPFYFNPEEETEEQALASRAKFLANWDSLPMEFFIVRDSAVSELFPNAELKLDSMLREAYPSKDFRTCEGKIFLRNDLSLTYEAMAWKDK